jgi:hypothetical protein
MKFKNVNELGLQILFVSYIFYTGRFITFCVITNIYKKKAIGPNIMEFFTATGKLKKIFF